MKFPRHDLRLVEIRPYTKKGEEGKPDRNFTFVKIADKLTFDSIEGMLSQNTDVRVLEPGKDYDVAFEVDNRFMSIAFYPVNTLDERGNPKPPKGM